MIDDHGAIYYAMDRKGGELMDIATKIKNARIKVNFTQEQVAEALGVSRQTISNWETGVSQTKGY